MKTPIRWLLILLIFCCLTGCSHRQAVANDAWVLAESSDCAAAKPRHIVGTGWSGDLIPDAQTAVAVATSIYEATAAKNDSFRGAAAQTVFYDETDDTWNICFSVPDDNDPETLQLGGEWNIALRKSDAAVVAVWIGE